MATSRVPNRSQSPSAPSELGTPEDVMSDETSMMSCERTSTGHTMHTVSMFRVIYRTKTTPMEDTTMSGTPFPSRSPRPATAVPNASPTAMHVAHVA
eukprot:CAMPEP_0180399352 /NCGR_PEP_ID=MMETSP0989-20121125/37127_1 /TAXON_ID=697907 /ORGANISM="non described non described, Strain CCMP2293" /LENGTH=96 /DNA_ID=CAMNT_0022402077 /DNA_START=71 /DNA_END=358 /DNA_ORIENTATION=+